MIKKLLSLHVCNHLHWGRQTHVNGLVICMSITNPRASYGRVTWERADLSYWGLQNLPQLCFDECIQQAKIGLMISTLDIYIYVCVCHELITLSRLQDTSHLWSEQNYTYIWRQKLRYSPLGKHKKHRQNNIRCNKRSTLAHLTRTAGPLGEQFGLGDRQIPRGPTLFVNLWWVL